MAKTANKTGRKLATAGQSTLRPAKVAQVKSRKEKDVGPGLAAPTRKPRQQAERTAKTEKSGSKQSRVLAMLRSPQGATIATMMKATGWQQHSVRGFLAGAVKKRLKLNLTSEKADGNRVYRISENDDEKSRNASSRRRAA